MRNLTSQNIGSGEWSTGLDKLIPATEVSTEVLREPQGSVLYILIGKKMIAQNCVAVYANHLVNEKEEANSQLEDFRNALEGQCHQMIEASPFPVDWADEGIQRPSSESKDIAISYIKQILNQIRIMPVRVSNSVEEGVFFRYYKEEEFSTVDIEVYNNGEAAGTLCQQRSVVKAINIESFDDIKELFKAW